MMLEQAMRIARSYARSVSVALFTYGLLLGLVGCGGGGNSATSIPLPTPTPTPTPSGALAVSPGNATLPLGSKQQFTATNNGSAAVVNWSVNGVAGGNSAIGTIDANGNYTAPASFPSPNNETVTATLQSNTSETGNSSVSVVYPNNNHTSQTPPIELGTTGGNSTDSSTSGMTTTCCSGTLGALVQNGGTLYILSANHVLDRSGQGAAGQPITQPGLVDNNCAAGTVVANLTQGAALKPSSGTSGPAPSNVDAAIAQIVTGMVDPTGGILDLGAAAPTSIAAAPPSATLAVPSGVLAANEGVAKSGRSTGLTCSTLQSVNTNVSVQYDSSCEGPVAFTSTFSNQVIVNGGNFSAAGDSGSLIVTSDTARSVALLYAGNATSTTGNPIQQVLSAFGPSFTVVGGFDHAVSCQPIAPASSVSAGMGASAAKLSLSELERVTAVAEKYAGRLSANAAVRDVSVTASADNPQEGAVLITVNGPAALPSELDGVRTRLVRLIYANSPAPRAGVADIERATAIKDSLAPSLMAQPGIQGVGVSVSDDNPAEAALVIYVISGVAHPHIPAVVSGLRTKMIEGDRFRAFGWGREVEPPMCSQHQAGFKPAKPAWKLPESP